MHQCETCHTRTCGATSACPRITGIAACKNCKRTARYDCQREVKIETWHIAAGIALLAAVVAIFWLVFHGK
jgi:hypothetical protein